MIVTPRCAYFRARSLAAASFLLIGGCAKNKGESTAPAPDAQAMHAKQPGENLREYYPERETPYDTYERGAKLLLRVAMRDPAQLNSELKNLTDIFSTEGPLQLEATIRELLHGWGVPMPVLEQLDPAGAYGASFSYPLRNFTGETWARVPAKDIRALTREVVTWLTLDEEGPQIWKTNPGEPDEAKHLDAAHISEGVYVHAVDGGLSFALRKARLAEATSPKSGDGREHDLLIELDGVASVAPDLLDDFDLTLHSGDRAKWQQRIESIDRAWATVDALADRNVEFGVGLQGRLDGWDEGLLGPARRSPARIAQALPGGAVAAMTVSWGNPAAVLQLIGDFRPTLGASALEREYLELASLTVDHFVEDVAAGVYVDRGGEHTLLLAASVDDPKVAAGLAERFIELLDRSMRAYDAGITAQEVSGELSVSDAKARRRSAKRTTIKVAKQKAPAFWVEMEDKDGTLAVMLDAKGRFRISAFVHKDTLFVVMGPGIDSVMRALGSPKVERLSKSQGLLDAHTRFDGCQVCGMSDGGLAARSLFGRAAKGLSPERRATARGLLPKLNDGGQSMFVLRSGPTRIDAMFVTDRARVAADPKAAEAWESFMQALGHRGETVVDPRQWLFGRSKLEAGSDRPNPVVSPS